MWVRKQHHSYENIYSIVALVFTFACEELMKLEYNRKQSERVDKLIIIGHTTFLVSLPYAEGFVGLTPKMIHVNKCFRASYDLDLPSIMKWDIMGLTGCVTLLQHFALFISKKNLPSWSKFPVLKCAP